MTSLKKLKGVAHDIAHHAGTGATAVAPHMVEALWNAGIETTWVELLEDSPYPRGIPEHKPLRFALQALHDFTVSLLSGQGFDLCEIESVRLHVTPAPWRQDGSVLHTRAVITATNGRVYDSGWVR